MDIVKIIGVGLIALIIIVVIRQYKPEFTMYVSIIAGVIILFLVLDKVTGIITLLTNLSKKNRDKFRVLKYITKNNRYSNTYRICSKHM